MSDQSNLCTRCGADNLRDSYFCVNCRPVPTMTTIDDLWIDELGDVKARNLATVYDSVTFEPITGYRIAPTERVATISRLCNLAADDDGKVFIPATADELAASVARIENSGDMTW